MDERGGIQEFRLDAIDRRKKIGEGGFAKVYDGIILQGNTCCAIKRFKREKVKPRQIEREVGIWAKLSHERIVKLMGIWCEEPNNGPFPSLILEKMDKSLSRFLEECSSRQNLTLSNKTHILLQVAEGIVFLHSKDLIHGDLTASNILLAFTGKNTTAKISDFGVSRMIAPVQETSTIPIGTESYMPPEIYEDPPRLSPKVDSFSFGVLIIHTLSCQLPRPLNATYVLEGRNTPRSEFERRERSIKMLSAECKNLLELIKRCLENDEKARPTARELLDTLELYSAAETNTKLTSKTVAAVTCKNERKTLKDGLLSPQLSNDDSQLRSPPIFHITAQNVSMVTNVKTENIATGNVFQNSHVQIGSNPDKNLVGNSRFSSPLKTEEFNLDFNKDEDSQDQRKLLKETASPRYVSDEKHLYYSFTDKSKVGFIIGGNGKNLKRIEKSTAARIHYEDICDCFVISGETSAIRQQSLEELKELIQNKTDLQVTARVSDAFLDHGCEKVESVELPTDVYPGAIIGKNGIHKKRIKRETGSKIRFVNNGNVFIISGGDRKKAAERINVLITGNRGTNEILKGTQQKSGEFIERSFSVPGKSTFGLFLGLSHRNIQHISSLTNCTIEICSAKIKYM